MKEQENEDWLEEMVDLDVTIGSKLHRIKNSDIHFLSSSFELLDDEPIRTDTTDYTKIRTEGYEAFSRRPISFKIHQL